MNLIDLTLNIILSLMLCNLFWILRKCRNKANVVQHHGWGHRNVVYEGWKKKDNKTFIIPFIIYETIVSESPVDQHF
jgi:hypothetical protein